MMRNGQYYGPLMTDISDGDNLMGIEHSHQYLSEYDEADEYNDQNSG